MNNPPVRLHRTGDLAVITIDGPPVNALSQAVRVHLREKLAEVKADRSLKGVVLACAGQSFSVGAEISELGQGLQPALPDIVDEIEALPIPSVAALFGTALGGGFELALGCTWRVASRSTRLGLPEVKLGLLPGAGGNVRSTYLAGAEATLRLAGSGEMITAAEGLRLGLVDALVDGDIVAAGLAYLAATVTTGEWRPPMASRRAAMQASDPPTLDRIAAELRSKARSDVTDFVAKAVQAAIALPFEEALEVERRLFAEALASPRSKALRHMFLAERAAARAPVGGGSARAVSRVGVVGGGTMGAGIAIAFADHGFNVVLREVDQPSLDRALQRIDAVYAASVVRGSVDKDETAGRQARISGTIHIGSLGDCDLIIEAAFEDMAVKKAVFRELGKVARADAILATNTSYLDVNEIAAAAPKPENVVGLHFFSPANVMRLMEVVRADRTSGDVVATALKLARAIGKQPVVVGVCHGFVGNRMLRARHAELSRLLLEGATPAQVDAAFRSFGWRMGPCQMQDLAGLDIGWRTRQALHQTDRLPDMLCEQGRFGQKSGKGWYSYAGDGRTPREDDEVLRLVTRLARQQGIARRTLSDAEIIARTHRPMIREGERILREGIAASSDDIDVIWVHGYGFPRELGGPMFWSRNNPDALRLVATADAGGL